MCVRWAKSIPAFVNLEMSDQVRNPLILLFFINTYKKKKHLKNKVEEMKCVRVI